eukprot:CAMPEP_0174299816 /NCGR_PEP_ID=MMETSP0809-20121228/57675_1 /TAXON_ID=73025 ORGANISM="Eutreptiella gymnastica-like, Strain CCMP1594" /NCGR_SAMPLE_ID=MMETSP0809 /ASSEMBLY_ACC=CAM_ASM_000658 /LENGTH=189 /DNA_ID=CAMNT_0015405245 /DNA_START=17 /DNA_END=583 /DNA_ORIENTATION=+
MSTYQVFYHTACKGFYGRALAAVQMLEEAGKPYECKEAGDFTAKAFAPPMIETPAGAKCGQTTAIAIVLGQELGYSPSDPAAFAKACQLVADSSDLFSDVSGGKDDERIKKWLQHFEDNLSGKFFCGDSLSFADFNCFMIFTGVSQMKAALMGGYPKVNAWIETMRALPSSEKLKATGVPFVPESMGGW